MDHVRERFTRAVNLLQTLPADFRFKIILWKPETGEEWEITPVSSRQTKIATSAVTCDVKP